MPQAGQINYPNWAAIFNAAANFRQQQLQEEKYNAEKDLKERQRMRAQQVAKQWQKATASALKDGDVAQAAMMIDDQEAQQKFVPFIQKALTERKNNADKMTLTTSQVLEDASKRVADSGFDPRVHHELAVSIAKREKQGGVLPGTLKRWVEVGGQMRAVDAKQSQSFQKMAGAGSPGLSGARMPETAMQQMQAQAQQAKAEVFADLTRQAQVERAGLIEDKVGALGLVDEAEKAAARTWMAAHPETAGLNKNQLIMAMRGAEDWRGMVSAEAARLEAEKLKRAKASAGKTVNVLGQPGSQDIEKGRILQTQIESAAIRSAKMKIGLIRKVAKPELFGLEGDVKGFMAHTAGYTMGENAPQWAREFQKSVQWLRGAGRIFVLDLLTSKSGKQVTDKEREFLLKAVGDPDNMTYDEYMSALEVMDEMMTAEQEGLTYEVRFGQNVLAPEDRESIDTAIAKARADYFDEKSPLFKDFDKLTKRIGNIHKDAAARMLIAEDELKKKTAMDKAQKEYEGIDF